MRTPRQTRTRLAFAALCAAALLIPGTPVSAQEAASVRINEIESNGGSPGDWVELVNTGSADVDVSGWTVKDNDDTHAFVLPAGTLLAAGGYLAVDVDPVFGLGAADSARLFAAHGTLVDSHSWTSHASTTYGRCPDGSGAFATTTTSTRAAANDCSAPNATAVKINEVESNGGTPGDWVELVNTGSAAVDVSGWVVKDNDDTHAYAIPAGTVIAGRGFVAVDVEVSFGLGGADSARLFQADGSTLVDSYTWTAHAATTYGRCPDGSGAFVATNTSTRGAANDCGTAAAAVRINEVESNGGTPGDWVELVNTGATAVDVSGWVFRDNDDTHTVTVAAGSTLAPGAFLALDTEPAFGLGSADSARLYLSDGTTLVDTYSWTAHAATTYGRCPNGTGAFTTTTSSTRGAANDCGAPVRINEVESNAGTPGDWVEIVNNGVSTVDVSGWLVKDNDDTHVYAIPAGTTVASGAFLALDVETAFGLGGADSARLFQADGATLVDAYTWTAHAATTYGRCPDGTGDFAATTAPTKGAGNACPGQVPAAVWPGGAEVTTADAANLFGGNMSGLAYQDQGVLWAVKNGPGTLYRLVRDGAAWTPDPAGGWAAGKALHYADGTGDLDAEGVTLTAAGPSGGVFVSTERNNADSGVSRPRIVRFDPAAAGTALNATMAWDLTADLPPVAANSGIEGITWISDAYLTAHGFADERTGKAYDPAAYPGHGDGLFLVGLEANGQVYAYALDQGSGAYTRVAAFASGFPAVMDLVFEPETGHLWAVCDDTCQGRTATLGVDASGRFAVGAVYERPAGMPNFNNEGFAIAPQSACVAGRKPVYWSDDSNDAGHALRGGTLPCTDLDADDDGIADDADPLPADPGNGTFSDDDGTSGRILDRAGRSVSIADTAGGVLVTVGAGTAPARVALDGGTAAIALGEGAYVLGGTGSVTVLGGEPAVATVAVQGTAVTVTVAAGGWVSYPEVTVKSGLAALLGIRSTGGVTVAAAGVPQDLCAAVQNVLVGSTRNETISGTEGADLILGKGGNDVVNGNGGGDCVVTGTGNDVVTTTSGDDRVDAGGGNNVVGTGEGGDVVRTGSGNDVVNAAGGDDRVEAGDGNNTVNSAAGDDAVTTGSGNDVVDCGAGTDTAHAGRGNNVNSGTRCEAFGV
ncbi:lamin tail domain-containing protein [Catellatospora sp. NPDC049111]|uniref:lamin tail domain-containing protein n=1 Tax=Catellatospora sp. NPDC049111 TaxID=3155271 RepID=UPI0033E2AF71